eukprot:TRINITY_DN8060_c2_g1_i2.p1 TRINITY_DN8060_c2_g1~~TRINITY_DN8060_c2_g1_i2.p1  ORF type:complete len:870 (+),score=346.17 TRINITY_DN8060_c2_g1_i2:286-2895(+)
MVDFGIQSLTVLMSVLTIVFTGALIGSISVTTSNDVLKKTRDEGDQYVQTCLSSGQSDVRNMSALYLNSVLERVEASVSEWLEGPERAIKTMVRYANARHPNESTSPKFIDESVRSMLFAEYASIADRGVNNLMFETLWWSKAHPHDTMADRGLDFTANDTLGWGGMITYFLVYTTGDTICSDTRNNDTMAFSNGGFIHSAAADPLGRLTPTDDPCDLTLASGKHGWCKTNRRQFEQQGVIKMRNEAILNVRDAADDDFLIPADQMYFYPAMAAYTTMWFILSHPYTHPDMLNLYPRQGNRVGHVSSIIAGETLVTLLQQQDLPSGSITYIVEKDLRKGGEVGKLLAYCKDGVEMGVYEYYFNAAYGMNMSKLLNVTDHKLPGTTDPSPIAEHAKTIFANGGYQETPVGNIVEWMDAEDTEFWTVVLHYRRINLNWYISLLVPRASVVGSIDNSTELIRKESNQARLDADERVKQLYIIMISVTVSVVTVLLIVSVVSTRFLVAPLHTLAGDMAQVAVMNLEGVNSEKGEASRLSEVAAMQQSFKMMFKNLMEFRNYMPQSVLLVKETESDDTNLDVCPVPPPSRRSNRSRGSSRSNDSAMQHYRRGRVSSAFVSDDGLKRRVVSVAYFNVKQWHAILREKSEHEFLLIHSRFVDEANTFAKLHKGVCEVFMGDRMLATFNTYSAVTDHRISCIQTAVGLSKRIEDGHSLGLSYACASGEVVVGHMGCKGMKKVTITASLMPWVVALERYNRLTGNKGTADSFVARDATGHFILRVSDAVMFPKRSEFPIKVFDVLGKAKLEAEEWMYQLEKANPLEDHNNVFTAIMKEDYCEAERLLEGIAPTMDDMYSRLKRYIAEQNYRPVEIMMH